jgi:hypothetical protein
MAKNATSESLEVSLTYAAVKGTSTPPATGLVCSQEPPSPLATTLGLGHLPLPSVHTLVVQALLTPLPTLVPIQSADGNRAYLIQAEQVLQPSQPFNPPGGVFSFPGWRPQLP